MTNVDINNVLAHLKEQIGTLSVELATMRAVNTVLQAELESVVSAEK